MVVAKTMSPSGPSQFQRDECSASGVAPHGLRERELSDILDPWEDPIASGPHLLPAEPALDFPGETFRVLKNKEEKAFGEYRTRRLVLEAWERLEGAVR